MSLAWVSDQILRSSRSDPLASVRVARFNPTPRGVIRRGSATDAVLNVLLSHPGVYLPRKFILKTAGRSRKSVDWALLFLRIEGLIDVAPGHTGSARFQRYCVTVAGLDAASARLLAAESRQAHQPKKSEQMNGEEQWRA